MKLLFFDNRAEYVKAYRRHLASFGVKFELADVREITADAFVSPANSYGVMDGGIDEIYMEMFPGVEQLVRAAIGKHGERDRYDKPLLPVGSALVVPVSQAATSYGDCAYGAYLICAPTMRIPQNIVNSPRNVYYAMLAILHCANALGASDTLAIPCLGTGVGRLSGEESASQVRLAMQDFSNGTPQYPDHTEIIAKTGVYKALF